MRIITILLILTILVPQIYGQSDTITFVNFYEYVVEYNFDNQIQNYKCNKWIKKTGTISVDKYKIFIEGYDNQADKTFKIISGDFDKRSQRDLFTCTFDGKDYIIAITKDKSYLTLISTDYLHIIIFTLKTDDKTQTLESQVNAAYREKNPTITSSIYLYGNVDKNPIFQTAKSDNDTKELLNKYILGRLKDLNWKKKGKAFVEFEIDKNGIVINESVIIGADLEFNEITLQIINSLPNWTPGEDDGENVNVKYWIEVKIE